MDRHGAAAPLVTAGLLGAAAWGNDFGMDEQAISLPGLRGTLDGVLVLPEHRRTGAGGGVRAR